MLCNVLFSWVVVRLQPGEQLMGALQVGAMTVRYCVSLN